MKEEKLQKKKDSNIELENLDIQKEIIEGKRILKKHKYEKYFKNYKFDRPLFSPN